MSNEDLGQLIVLLSRAADDARTLAGCDAARAAMLRLLAICEQWSVEQLREPAARTWDAVMPVSGV